jgi:cell wall-associated NlpC family hydrolase
MNAIIDALPASFWSVPYYGARTPDQTNDLSDGANCQRFAYAVLGHLGQSIPSFRSSELWEDARYTQRVTQFQPMDLLLFGPDSNAWGAHVALCAGDGHVLHLSKHVGFPAVWSFAQFEGLPRYQVLIGAKRII